MKVLKIVVTTLFFAVIAVFFSAPKVFMQSFLDGVTVWALNVLPALFPFAVLSTLALKFFPKFKFSPCKALFGVRADEIFITSLLCGYPVGAKVVAQSNFDEKTSTALCAFCSTPSPVFVVATVGAKLLNSAAATWILAIGQLLAAIFNGILFKSPSDLPPKAQKGFSAGDVGETVTSAVLSVLSVGGLIALFYLLADVLRSVLPQSVSQSLWVSFLLGLLEMTNGIVSVCGSCDLLSATVLSSFLLGFGGLCVFAQNLAFLGDKIKPHKFLQIKFVQGSLAAISTFVLGKIFLH